MNTFTHGSEDSLDHDTYVIFDKIPTAQEAKEYCASLVEDNANILVLKDGIVDWCYKGTEDECNNSLNATYGLHLQFQPNPILRNVERDVDLKVVRTLRGLLSYFSRTEMREQVKKALKSKDAQLKLSVFSECDISNDIDFVKSSKIEAFKFFAFQIGQTDALINGKELYTKSQVAEEYPALRPYLYREDVDCEALQDTLALFKSTLHTYIENLQDPVALFKRDCISKF